MKIAKHICRLTVLGIVVFHVYTALFGILPSIYQPLVQMSLILFLISLSYVVEDRSLYSFFRLALCAVVIPYTLYHGDRIPDPAYLGGLDTTGVAVGGVFIFLLLDVSRKELGTPFVIVIGLFLAYAFLGHYVPGVFNHPPLSVHRVVESLYFSPLGIWGLPMSVASTFLAVFIIFAGVMQTSGMTDYVFRSVTRFVGNWTGGPAKVAVLSSALVGSVAGNAMANVVTTGSLTIPLMKRVGYKPEFAAATEASASTGGQIMPPIMGTAAFLMAQILGITYSSVVIAALIPAALYFISIFIFVHFEAKQRNLQNIKSDPADFISTRELLSHCYHIVPLATLIVAIVVLQRPIMQSGLWALYAAFAVWVVEHLRNKTLTLDSLWEACESSVHPLRSIVVACGAVGIIIGVVGITGLGSRLSMTLVELVGGNLWSLSLVTALAALILGTGLPTLAVYLVLAIIIAPALMELGVPGLAAHLFVFFFANMSSVTPPVALASLLASGIAGSNFWKTSILAFQMVIPAMVLAFGYIFRPNLILVGDWGWHTAVDMALALFGGIVISRVFVSSGPSWLKATAILCGAAIVLLPVLESLLLAVTVAIAFYAFKYLKVINKSKEEPQE